MQRGREKKRMSEIFWAAAYCVLGIFFAIVVAGGLFAFITTIGVITRLAAGTKTAKYVMLYETMVILGASVFNAIDLFKLESRFLWNQPVAVSLFWCFYGGFAGIFTGCLAAALAEVVQVLPVFAKRIRLKTGLPYIVAAFAAGKGFGAWYQLVFGAGK